jgi:hypothetical protein
MIAMATKKISVVSTSGDMVQTEAARRSFTWCDGSMTGSHDVRMGLVSTQPRQCMAPRINKRSSNAQVLGYDIGVNFDISSRLCRTPKT